MAEPFKRTEEIVPFKKMPADVLASTNGVCSDKGGWTSEHAAWLRQPDNAMLIRVFMDQQLVVNGKNPYEMTLDEQLAALRRAIHEEGWRITKEDFTRLAATAPAWPKGKNVFRLLRIRFGEGNDGVAKTFEAHCARIKSVFGERHYWRWEHLHSSPTPYQDKPVERLRLLNGNHTHHAVVEWVIADLDIHRVRESITAVRDSNSLADELLVIAWMFPDMIRAMDYDKLPGLFAGGYEVNVPEDDGEAWQSVVYVYFDRDDRQVSVNAHDRSDGDSDDSVPALRESEALAA